MIYQPILLGNLNYVVGLSDGILSFPLHVHHEIELMYCVEGTFDCTVEGQKFTVSAGQLLAVGSMQQHEYFGNTPVRRLIIEIGPTFLQDRFQRLAACRLAPPILNCPLGSPLRALLDEICSLCADKSNFTDADAVADLTIIGDLYKVCAFILQNASLRAPDGSRANRPSIHIEPALELIYQHYKEPLTVDDAAALTGYGKSNFCKIFKNAVGMTFHAYLNSFRIKNACYLLTETAASVEEIGTQIGFSDAKTFCRVFRSMLGITPGQYRSRGKAGPVTGGKTS